MNNKINIAEVLKDCPKGMKLYSPIFGKVELVKINDKECYQIHVKDGSGNIQAFTENGLFRTDYSDAECLLFPSLEMRDWSKFSWKKGDVLVSKDGKKECIFDEFINDSYISFLGRHYLNCSDENNIEYEDDGIYLTENYSLEVEDAAKCYINTIQERLGGKLNPENLEIESIKSKCGFKPFDRVLVRNSLNKNWSINLFSYYDKENEDFPYVCINGSYPYCIPYEGNEYLINTTKDY